MPIYTRLPESLKEVDVIVAGGESTSQVLELIELVVNNLRQVVSQDVSLLAV